jgi:N-methylhydantoinase B
MRRTMDAVELNIFASRLEAVCDEMGAVLRNAAFSPNIRDRLDFSCAVFGPGGDLAAQAAHIPVHLGSMAYAMRDVVDGVDWAPGDALILNDPFLGGTHLPDVTLVSPVHAADGRLAAFVVNRAHHADIGCESPGSMPVSSRLDEEGLVIPPTRLMRGDRLEDGVLARLCAATRNPAETSGDIAAQLGANRVGGSRLRELIRDAGRAAFLDGLRAVDDYAERLALDALRVLPDGEYQFEDVLDDDGLGTVDIPIRLTLRVRGGRVHADFAGTSPQVPGNVNCPLSVAAASVYYAFRCLMPPHTPACAGAFRPVSLSAPAGSLLNARRPAAVAAGNVETSSRVVDVLLGALAKAVPHLVPAASQGTMNNVAMGASGEGGWDYYETIGGGMGAGPSGDGRSGVQTHMTNTLNTPIEVLESRFPLRVRRYALRRGSGGAGRRRGGDGLARELEFLAPARVSLLTERRRHSPWGLAGGAAGQAGANRLNGEPLPAKCQRDVAAGDRLLIETPGGGGWGAVPG